MADPVAHSIHRLSSIARPVEPRYPTNLAILILMGLALVGLAVTALVRGAAPIDATLAGLLGALVVFATWALGRDLAPDDDPAAFVALVPAAAVVAVGVTPHLLGPLVALGLVRVVNRSVGPPATTLDRVALVVLTFVVAREGHGYGVGLAAVLAFGLDAVLPGRAASAGASEGADRPRRSEPSDPAGVQGWAFAALAAATTAMGMIIGEPTLSVVGPGPWTIAAIVTAGLFALVALTQPTPRAVHDAWPEVRLRRDRVRGGMLVGLLAVAPTLLGGDAAVLAWGVPWAACAGVVLTRPLHLWRRRATAVGPQAQSQAQS